MANQKVSDMTQRTPDGTEFIEVIIPPFTPGTNRKVLLQDAIDLASGGSPLDQVEVEVAGAPIVLDFDNKVERMFVGDDVILTPKTISFANDTNALLGQLVFDIGDIAAVLTFPSDVIMQGSDSRWNAGTFEFTPDATEKHEFAFSWDGENWLLKAGGGSGGGGGGGAVDSVNGQTGTVVLDAGDVGADPAGSASTVATNLSNHISDTSAAHAASAISVTPVGSIASTDVQSAVAEIDGDVGTLSADLSNHISDATAAHAATAIAFTPAGSIAATTVQAAIEEVAAESGSSALKVLVIACSDEITPITAAANKVKFRLPYAMTVSAVRASLSTAQTSGSIFTVDIHESGTTILSTKLTIDNGETTSTTAATPAVISDTALADNAEITIDVDQIGDNTAKGLKVTIIGS